MNKLSLKNVQNTYIGGYRAIADADFELMKGDRLCIIGESLSGKTTLLKLIAGLEAKTAGEILFDGDRVFDAKELNIGYFTEDAMRRGQTVLKTIEYPLNIRKTADAESSAIRAASLFGIDNLVRLRIKDLNSVQRKLVALARTFAYKRDLYLLDNPFGNLPYESRSNMTDVLLRAVDGTEGTVIFATDSVEEAERIGFMQNALLNYGALSRRDSLRSLYLYPRSLADASLIAGGRINKVVIKENGAVVAMPGLLNRLCLIGSFDNITAAFYYDDFIKDDKGYRGKIIGISSDRAGYVYTALIDNAILKVSLCEKYKIGDDISIMPKTENIKIFDTMSEQDIVKRN